MIELLQKEFGFYPTEITKLNGYDNLNFLIKTEDKKYIFKTYLKSTESLAIVEAENKTLLFLQNTESHKFPRPIKFTDGSFVKCVEIDGKETICRMLSFIEGELMGNTIHSKTLFRSFGVFLAKMDIYLQSHSNKVIKERQWVWNIENFDLNKKYIKEIALAKNRKLVRHFFQQFEDNAVPVLPNLRKYIIHNDANDWNVLVTHDKVSGIIDFDDLAYAPLINELAVAITYACFDKDKPLEWASIILRSYHTVLPIKENEIGVLYYLVAARLCVSICNAAHSKNITPDNTYAFVSEKPALKSLYIWLNIGPLAAENHFRSAIGLRINHHKTN